MRRWYAVSLATLAVSMAAPAYGQSAQEELARRELITQAEQSRAAGDHAHALDLALRAGEIHMTTSLRVLLSLEHRAVGHTVEALSNALECVREAQLDTALRNRERILPACESLVAELEPLVGHLRVIVPDGAPTSLHLRVGGADLLRALWGVPYPVMPGDIHVEATSEGTRPWQAVVAVNAGQTSDVNVVLDSNVLPPPTPVEPTPPTATTPPPPALPLPQPTPAPQPEHPRASSGPGAGPWLLLTLGGVGFIAAGITYVAAQNNWSTLTGPTGTCPNGQCPTTGVRTSELARSPYTTYRSFTYATDVGIAVGGAGVAAGLLWWLLARPSSASTSQSVAWGVTPGAGSFTVNVQGAL